MQEPETAYVTTPDGFHIGYQTFGEGPPDIVINDAWMSNVDANWDVPEYAQVYSGIARLGRCIAFDRRGFGISDRVMSSEEMAIEKGMEDMRTVMDAVGSERVVAYGFEDGCAVSLLFAASFPERTSGLVLCAPFVTYWKTDDFPWGFSEEDAREWVERIESSWGTEAFWRWNNKQMGEEPDPERDRRQARWSRLCASPAAALAIEQIDRQVDVRAILPSIQVPTLILETTGDVAEAGRPWGAGAWVADQIPGARLVQVPGAHFMDLRDPVVFDELARFHASLDENEREFDRVVTTVLFTDIVGSTERAAQLGDHSWKELVERHHAAVRSILRRFRGVEVDTAGDGFFATFDGPARAIRCAQAIRDAVGSIGLEVRAGLHTGEAGTIDGKVGGLAVVIGARVGAMAGASEVLVSQTVKDLVAGSGIRFEDRGWHTLKGVPDEWRVFAVAA
jgi:class 3 adenylate cyclase